MALTMAEAEERLDLAAAIDAGKLTGEPGTERTVYDCDTGEPVVSYWPTPRGFDARWHRREGRPDMDGDLTCDGGLSEDERQKCYYSEHDFAHDFDPS